MSRRLLMIGSLVLVLLGALPAAASATFIPGPAGKLVFASGRANNEGTPADGNDDKAKIWVADYPFGTPVQVTTLPANTQHRHPNWSPDHTRIVYAAGVAFSGTYALWIADLRTGEQTQFVPAAEKQDRPSWSPDGTTIAYGSLGDLWVKGVDGGTAVNLTETPGVVEERPVWSQDGNTLYYNRGVSPDRDLYKLSPVTPGSAQIPIEIGATDDWQPALSPDGDTLCFLRGPQSDAADLYTIGVDGGSAQPFATGGVGDLNCVWSPDGTKILYTLGAFSGGDLITRNVDGSGPSLLTGMNVAKHFEGNADWATNFSPTCEDRNVAIPVNGFVSVEFDCTDPDAGAGKEAPHPEDIGDSFLEVVSPPAHGTLSGLSDRKVIYTPNKDFSGTDSFTYTGSDSVSDAAPAKVTIKVGQDQPPAAVDKTKPVVSAIKISNKRWRLGSKLASISRSPLGTTISFRLSEAAQASVGFQRQSPGRLVGGKCAKPTAANRSRKACKRYLGAGRLGFAGAAGANKVKFQGRLSNSKKLAPGTYRIVIGARDAAGNIAQPKTGPTFTIVTD